MSADSSCDQPPVQQNQTQTKQPGFQLLKLSALDHKGEKYFKVYADDDVIADLPSVNKRGQETLVDSAQDDDVESDDEVVQSGI